MKFAFMRGRRSRSVGVDEGGALVCALFGTISDRTFSPELKPESNQTPQHSNNRALPMSLHQDRSI